MILIYRTLSFRRGPQSEGGGGGAFILKVRTSTRALLSEAALTTVVFLLFSRRAPQTSLNWMARGASPTQPAAAARTHTHTLKHRHTNTQSCTMTQTNHNSHVSLKNLVFFGFIHTLLLCEWLEGGSTGHTHTRTRTHTHTHTHTRGGLSYLLLTLILEAQTRRPLLEALAVVRPGLVRLELHPGPASPGGLLRLEPATTREEEERGRREEEARRRKKGGGGGGGRSDDLTAEPPHRFCRRRRFFFFSSSLHPRSGLLGPERRGTATCFSAGEVNPRCGSGGPGCAGVWGGGCERAGPAHRRLMSAPGSAAASVQWSGSTHAALLSARSALIGCGRLRGAGPTALAKTPRINKRVI